MCNLVLSIIIPVYNVELYIERCLCSCLNQNISSDKYEIILVDDGSPDNSIEKIDYIISNNDNVILLRQSNEGLSSARNKGLSVAKGRYIWFVDSDDWLAENSLVKLFQYLTADYDIITFCASNVVDGVISRRFSYEKSENKVFKGRDLLLNGKLQHCVPFSVYRKDFLKNNALFFYKGIFHEDTEFTPRAYYFSTKIVCINDVFYYVYCNPLSITRTFNFKKKKDLFIVADRLFNFKKSLEDKNQICFNNIISLAINSALENRFRLNQVDKKILDKLIFDARYLSLSMIHSNKLKYKVEGVIFYISPLFFILFYSLWELTLRKLR